MLEAEKAQLESNLAVEVLRVRDRELTFYSECFSTIGTQAALIASISFAILTSMSWDLKDPDGGWLHYNTSLAWGVRRDVDPSELGIGSWSVWTWIEQLLTLAEVCFCVGCLTTQLVLIQRCALVEIGGLSLALRGPDGSAQKALHHMRLEVRRSQRLMIRGVQFLAVTIVLLIIKDLPLPIAVLPCLIAVARLWDAQSRHYKLEEVLELPLSELQTSSPVQPNTPARRQRVQRWANAMATAGSRTKIRMWRFLCCEDDDEAEVLERHNSRHRTTAEVVTTLIKRNQDDKSGARQRQRAARKGSIGKTPREQMIQDRDWAEPELSDRASSTWGSMLFSSLRPSWLPPRRTTTRYPSVDGDPHRTSAPAEVEISLGDFDDRATDLSLGEETRWGSMASREMSATRIQSALRGRRVRFDQARARVAAGAGVGGLSLSIDVPSSLHAGSSEVAVLTGRGVTHAGSYQMVVPVPPPAPDETPLIGPVERCLRGALQIDVGRI